MTKEELKKAALDYHQGGKIEINVKTSVASQDDLSLAYSPGVAYPCLEIEKDANKGYELTNRSNLVGVISNGTAILGLGDLGALASKPVMEGKSVLFKRFAGIDAFDIELDEKDPKKLVDIVRALAPTFGGINLEDIKAPECFYIETELKKILDIPIMHDDQHGTAIICTAGIINGAKIVNKNISNLRVVVCGAGGAAISCATMARALGVKDIVMFDSKGALTTDRSGLDEHKRAFAVDKAKLAEQARSVASYKDALKGADVLLGLSRADIISEDDIAGMSENPLIFVMSNPNPEIAPALARKARPDAIIATGRSDEPNQINNVLGFPYIFKGALSVNAKAINEEMKMAAANALAELARDAMPSDIKAALESIHGRKIEFGKEYVIPSPFDPRLLEKVSGAVADAARKSGVARK